MRRRASISCTGISMSDGMVKCVRVEEDALEIGEKLYDKRIYEKQK